ncbi:TPA: hypothetical protein N0F65_001151 [Lagenidium giganteum]|uniref:BZIP domain-containing protein n=1 Tax=Lagenidium giganteum TaxID=4803 RepID=A0AAV2YU71_9STRA|nr:TPA: hypothetical protein N0F65_001151 [Lagenidium giganteum]
MDTTSTSASPPGPMSGIDWSIFRDGEESAFGWLLRNSANFVPSTPTVGPASTSPVASLLHAAAVAHAARSATTAATAVAAVASPQLQQQQQRTRALSLDEIQLDDQEASLLGLDATTAMPATTTSTTASTTAPALRVDVSHGHGWPGGEARGSSASTPGDLSVSAMSSHSGGDEDRDQDDADDSTSPHSEMPTGARAGGGKRPLKRKKTPQDGKDEDSKQQLRRIKNLVSVREFRKRKMKQLEQNEAKLKRLEAENLDLKMRLKIGKEALASEQQEKKQIKEQMSEMLKRGASEQEIAQFLNMYKITYSDYGPKRREKLKFHLARIRELLLPTQVTKLCLYSVEQGNESMVTTPAKAATAAANATLGEEDATASMTLWNILAKELDVSEAQQRQLLKRRGDITKVRENLAHTLAILDKLESVTEEKNTALESQVAQLQQILTASQATRFILWVKENPAFMYMLDKLVDSTLKTVDDN